MSWFRRGGALVARTVTGLSAQLRYSTDAWYADGLKFSCTSCGKCCSALPGAPAARVWVTAEEITRLAVHEGVAAEQLLEEATIVADGRLALARSKDGASCIFLEGRKCRVHAARPTQCHTYPFWPQTVATPVDWESTAFVCEGINADQATTVSAEEITTECVVEELSRAGELGGTYPAIRKLLSELDPELVTEYAHELVGAMERTVVHETETLRVVDTLVHSAPSTIEAGPPPASSATRSLVFKASPLVEQTVVALDAPSGNPVHGKLLWDAHRGLALALSLLSSGGGADHHDEARGDAAVVAIIGGGGGALPLALKPLPWIAHQIVVEPDVDLWEVAEQWFGLVADPSLSSLATDGAAFLAECSPASLDAVLVDAAEADGGGGGALRAPPASLCTAAALWAADRALRPSGVFAANALDLSSARALASGLRTAMPRRRVYLLRTGEAENVVVVALASAAPSQAGLENAARARPGLPPLLDGYQHRVRIESPDEEA
mmetsp:Transcript_30662/g.99717  ORF Transcript_30662/g.99717 Transcript_30662/m.99717 type:complete len:496 (-) Transcript_30662:393-1880(-)